MRLREILERLYRGELSPEEAERLIRPLLIEEIGERAKIDIGRLVRRDVPEIVLGEKKSQEDLQAIVTRTLEKSGRVIVSKLSEESMGRLVASIDGSEFIVKQYREAGVLTIRRREAEHSAGGGRVGIMTAGTSDIPVAIECEAAAEFMGCETFKAFDVGVAGIQRLFKELKRLLMEDVDVLVVIAGREGALPSVVAGLVSIPVIAVPTSVGYGFGRGGVAALAAMLQSCSLGVTVVNIDGGIPAGIAAALISNRAASFRRKEGVARGA